MAIRVGTPRWMDAIVIHRVVPVGDDPMYVLGGPVPAVSTSVLVAIQIDPLSGQFIGELRYASRSYYLNKQGQWTGTKLTAKAHDVIMRNLHRVIDEVGFDNIRRVYVQDTGTKRIKV